MISFLVTVTPLHAERVERMVDTPLRRPENVFLVLLMVLLVRPPWIS